MSSQDDSADEESISASDEELFVDESSEDEEEDEGVDWNAEFEDETMEFDHGTHAVNSELGLSDESTPFQILQKLLTKEMVEKICRISAPYAVEKGIKPFEEEEFWRFLAVTLAMGITRKPAIKDYWRKSKIFHTPFFGETMSRDRYRGILSSLHFVSREPSPGTSANDRFGMKLGSFLDDLVKNFRNSFHAGEFLCLDESLMPFKGRLAFKQYCPKKRARFGIKLFILSDCLSKGILDILPYQGKGTKIPDRSLITSLGFGGAAVVTMLERYMDYGHRIVIDNWFNSPKLARVLYNRKTYVLGTVQKRRKEMPTGARMTRKLKKGEIEVFSDGKLVIERWNDRREVIMLNTFLPHSMQSADTPNPRNQRDKPGSVLLYNSKMGAVDDADKIVKPYQSIRKSYVWYRKVFIHLVDLAVYNSAVLYKQQSNARRKLAHVKFLEMLILNILETYPCQKEGGRGRPLLPCDNDRLTGQHFPEKMTKRNKRGKTVSSKSDCSYCKIVYGVRKSTSYRCTRCLKRLCIGEQPSCFQLFHTKKNLRRCRNPLAAVNRMQGPAVFSQSVNDSEDVVEEEEQENSVSMLAQSDSDATQFDEAEMGA